VYYNTNVTANKERKYAAVHNGYHNTFENNQNSDAQTCEQGRLAVLTIRNKMELNVII
jgi:hypothetical protein